MAEIAWTFEVRRWMQKIYGYIAEDNPEAAERTVNAVHARAEALLKFPENRSIEILGVFHGALDIRRYLS